MTGINSSHSIDMTEGAIFPKLMHFSIPLIFSGLLQLLFNAADIIVVGRFAGDISLAAVGSNGPIINLLTNLFVGLSLGTNVVASHFFGAKNGKALRQTVHTAILISIYSGIFLTVVGVFGAEFFLKLMKAPPEVFKLASLYLKIYFGGITATMIYNFGSAILRSKGDTERPLYFLLFAGIINVILNVIFVVVFKLDVAGVAIATVISQCIAAVLVIRCLVKEKSNFKLSFRHLKIDREILIKIMKIGIPSGLQGILFSFSNVIIQSSVNSFGPIMIAGNSAAANLEGFVYTSMYGIAQGATTFCSQNAGAGKFDRIKKTVLISECTVFAVGFLMGMSLWIFGTKLLKLYTINPEVIKAGLIRASVIGPTYFLCGAMEVMSSSIRALGYSVMPMIVTLAGACGLRLLWLATVFQIEIFHTPKIIFTSYPISWLITFIVHVIYFFVIIKRFESNFSKA